MTVEVGAGRDEANPTGTRMHKMKKKADVERGAYGQEKLERINYADVQGASDELAVARSEHVCKL